MKMAVDFSFDRSGSRASLTVEISTGRSVVMRQWEARGRAFTMSELDDIWAAVGGEIDVQGILGPTG